MTLIKNEAESKAPESECYAADEGQATKGIDEGCFVQRIRNGTVAASIGFRINDWFVNLRAASINEQGKITLCGYEDLKVQIRLSEWPLTLLVARPNHPISNNTQPILGGSCLLNQNTLEITPTPAQVAVAVDNAVPATVPLELDNVIDVMLDNQVNPGNPGTEDSDDDTVEVMAEVLHATGTGNELHQDSDDDTVEVMTEVVPATITGTNISIPMPRNMSARSPQRHGHIPYVYPCDMSLEDSLQQQFRYSHLLSGNDLELFDQLVKETPDIGKQDTCPICMEPILKTDIIAQSARDIHDFYRDWV
jgi:hypothetical protein